MSANDHDSGREKAAALKETLVLLSTPGATEQIQQAESKLAEGELRRLWPPGWSGSHLADQVSRLGLVPAIG